MAEGSNLTIQCQFMVQPLVPFCNYIILRTFWMGYINVYWAHAVAPQCLMHCIFMIPGNG